MVPNIFCDIGFLEVTEYILFSFIIWFTNFPVILSKITTSYYTNSFFRTRLVERISIWFRPRKCFEVGTVWVYVISSLFILFRKFEFDFFQSQFLTLTILNLAKIFVFSPFNNQKLNLRMFFFFFFHREQNSTSKQ